MSNTNTPTSTDEDDDADDADLMAELGDILGDDDDEDMLAEIAVSEIPLSTDRRQKYWLCLLKILYQKNFFSAYSICS